MTPRLSFIIPVFNPDIHLLKKVIKALEEQSYKDFEVIFVLDGENKTAEKVIANGTQDSKFPTQILYQEHKGAPAARNLGLAKAVGEFLVFWDCDCLIEIETAKTWILMFDKDPETGFVYASYKFLNEMGAIEAREFDPFTLKIRNYISTCFPVRRKFLGKWDESLKSLQDWDWWLQVVEKGAKGKFLEGYAFSTPFPTENSISGQGCTKENWLDRVDAVKKKHGLKENSLCVSSINKVHEGIWLAKLLDCDFQEVPNDKPHRYKTFIQVGFSFLPELVGHSLKVFDEPNVRKIIILTSEDITEITTRFNLKAIWQYSVMLRGTKVFVEDNEAKKTLERAGFTVEVRPMPLVSGNPPPLPKRPNFAVDVTENYQVVMNVIEKSLPDVDIVPLRSAHQIKDFSGLIHLHPDKTVSIGMRRMIMAGRPVISNVQAPFMGYVDDTKDLAEFIPALVNKIRRTSLENKDRAQERNYYDKKSGVESFRNEIS